MAKTFYEFMMQYKNKESPRGDLAGDMYYAQTRHPEEGDLNLIDSKDRLLTYLFHQGACDACIEVAKRCWDSYRRYLKSVS